MSGFSIWSKAPAEREWYIRQHGRSRNVLVLQIESGLHRRQGKGADQFHGCPAGTAVRPRAANNVDDAIPNNPQVTPTMLRVIFFEAGGAPAGG